MFSRVVNPQYVVISAGEGNNYGHPHQEVLERAADVGAAVLRTDLIGTVAAISDGEKLWWESHD
jgi:competence protein ComEC